MSNSFLINKSGKSVSIFEDPDGKVVSGTLNNREAFGYNRDWGGDDVINSIVYLNSSGKLNYGYLIDPPSGVMTACTDYPYGNVTINGVSYKTFLMRKKRNIYTATGNLWGYVAENCRVACRSALSGSSNPHWKAINYVESSSGEWVKVTGDDVTYGFVDTGLEIASGYKSIPFYGSWCIYNFISAISFILKCKGGFYGKLIIGGCCFTGNMGTDVCIPVCLYNQTP